MKINLNNFNNIEEDIKEDLEMKMETMDNPYAWEDYCGACDNFGEPDLCPFFEKVNDHTKWKKLRCIDFID